MSQKSGSNGLVFGKFPAVITKYDPGSRECMIKTPVGDEVDAEIEYPIGDKSANGYATEIEILPGDKVWCEFIQGDTRRALITGWRNPKTGNSSGTRRWHHANIELVADSTINLIVGGSTIKIDQSTIALVAAAISTQGAFSGTGNMSIQGAVESSDDVVAGGVSVQGHKHFVPKEGADSEAAK